MFRIHYEASRRELDVTFTSGKTYTYFAVPQPVYERFLRAASHGAFLNTSIKDQHRFVERPRGWRRTG